MGAGRQRGGQPAGQRGAQFGAAPTAMQPDTPGQRAPTPQQQPLLCAPVPSPANKRRVGGGGSSARSLEAVEVHGSSSLELVAAVPARTGREQARLLSRLEREEEGQRPAAVTCRRKPSQGGQGQRQGSKRVPRRAAILHLAPCKCSCQQGKSSQGATEATNKTRTSGSHSMGGGGGRATHPRYSTLYSGMVSQHVMNHGS